MSIKDQTNPILIGALFVHFMNFSIQVMWGSQLFMEFENKLVRFNRCMKILEIPQEAEQHKVGFDGKSWPKEGAIEFKNYSLKYRPDTEIVLNEISFKINSKEKIGVVGRTGAGKSTICIALCRIVEAHSGSILIDGQDISKLGLSDMRDKITIIPQDPTLFDGTLRFNLDPESKFSDDYIMDLAKQASLEKLIKRDEKGLDQMIEEHGQNLSSGEKQLLCICRAILKQNKVVLMDEATANIDIKTEEIIQKLIQEQFKESTVITIAHRLNTIINSDKVLVLERGKVKEFDCPKRLLEDQNSVFYSYVKALKKQGD